ncbi:hypothetical protein BT96DRAFT_960394 [Gymnopus androsaceus JB14]|uniref:Uncharacterized protein n=1 Tax=Gymnopus androsaceus JB14 TaxID=1447944 RepID=A0A6A4GQG8_9AGAR|nr:hypothetical protein BT96DRAFT_960394 [Gymnopus androsaceus JB14]
MTTQSQLSQTLFMNSAYNGYKSHHAIKFQAPYWYFVGPIKERPNDYHLLHESKLVEWCYAHVFHPGANANTDIQICYFHLFGDPVYGIKQTEEEKEWNEAMTSICIEVEHGFADTTRSWPFLNAWWLHRVYSSPVGKALNCIRPNQASQSFDCEPPTLDEYFTL